MFRNGSIRFFNVLYPVPPLQSAVIRCTRACIKQRLPDYQALNPLVSLVVTFLQLSCSEMYCGGQEERIFERSVNKMMRKI